VGLLKGKKDFCMKKLLSLALACATVLCLSAPAFALDQSLSVTAATNVPTIKVVMPSNVKGVTLNPYKLEVKYTPVKTGATEVTKKTQIVAPTMFVTNLSSVDMKVAMTVTGTVGGNAKLGTASFASDTTTKTNSVFLTLEAAVKDDQTEVAATAFTADEAGKMIISTTKKEMTGFKKADAAAATNTLKACKADGSVADAGGYLALSFGGDCVTTPTIDWTKSDTVGASIAFTFTPQAAT